LNAFDSEMEAQQALEKLLASHMFVTLTTNRPAITSKDIYESLYEKDFPAGVPVYDVEPEYIAFAHVVKIGNSYNVCFPELREVSNNEFVA